MEPSPSITPTAILFDLDNTLFDHSHSLHCAILSLRNCYPEFSTFSDSKLTTTYHRCLEEAYNSYLRKTITYAEKDIQKIKSFFTELELPEPSVEEIQHFRQKYSKTYKASRRATTGSIETLVRLKGEGHKLAIVTNGPIKEQNDKAEAIGVSKLVDRIFTSEEVGVAKPDRRVFEFALEGLDVDSWRAYMVGDNLETDIKGALDVGVSPILFDPDSDVLETERLLFGKQVPVIRDMHGLLGLFGIKH
jgi:HAD superfamily hydrolase (TIGR01549 family)